MERAKTKKADRSSLTDCRILVVDDNPGVLKLIGSLFEERDIAVCLSTSVKEARHALDEAVEPFDLVLSDIQMPKETGFDLLEWIKKPGSKHADLPVLLTTAQLPETENRLKGLSMGAVDYVVRPIELNELVIRALIAIENVRRIRALEKSLATSENLAFVGRLMAASNHEIKNLAALVKLGADHLLRLQEEGQVQSESAQKALHSVREASALLTDVARNVSTLLDPERLVLKPIDLHAIVNDLLPLMQERVRPYRLVISGNKVALFAKADAVRVKQVLINLILNAADAIAELSPPEGGKILITCEESPDALRLQVKDNGIGLNSPGEMTDFQAFSTTKKLRGGQGLGLWLSARLTSGMGGRLTLASGGGGLGATATIQLLKSQAPDTDTDDLAADVQRYLAELD